MSKKFVFEWNKKKEKENIKKHGVSFKEASKVFDDPLRTIIKDVKHSTYEERLFCIGRVKDKILTVRFIERLQTIRIFGAGLWRGGKKIYEKKNSIQRSS